MASSRTRPSHPSYDAAHQRNPLTSQNPVNRTLSTLTSISNNKHMRKIGRKKPYKMSQWWRCRTRRNWPPGKRIWDFRFSCFRFLPPASLWTVAASHLLKLGFSSPSHEQWPPIIYLSSPLLSALFPAVLLSFLRVVGSTCTEGAWSFVFTQASGPSSQFSLFWKLYCW